MIYDDYAEIILAFPPGSLLGSTARRQTRRETRRWIIHSTPRPEERSSNWIGTAIDRYWELEEAARNSVQGCQPDLWIIRCLFVQSWQIFHISHYTIWQKILNFLNFVRIFINLKIWKLIDGWKWKFRILKYCNLRYIWKFEIWNLRFENWKNWKFQKFLKYLIN